MARIHGGVVPSKQRGLRNAANRHQTELTKDIQGRMGRFIDDILQPGEKVLYSTNAHWIFFLPAIVAWIAAGALLVAARTILNESVQMICLSLAGLAAIMALYWTLRAWFHRWTTETDVTTLRVVHKTGFIKRNTIEMGIDKIASVSVDQNIFGRVFNYGDVKISSVGEAEEKIKTIASPLTFRNSITAR
jgi:uncharacterized membrane protein YdbT with pleckstrin-like domain